MTQCSQELWTEKSPIFELCFRVTAVTHGVSGNQNQLQYIWISTIQLQNGPGFSTGNTCQSISHCLQTKDQCQVDDFISGNPAPDTVPQFMFPQYMAQQHYASKKYMAKYLSANTTNISRKFPSLACQKIEYIEGKTALSTCLRPQRKAKDNTGIERT